uniref:Eukaryotic translation initiation factor 5A n=1 Tax=Spirometra erinaceieuropaei TaxID=99802 RepID=K7X6Z0_SPIER|nr:Eukaryotic translation initiation factor eIF-5A [Spirometra erinaceieuropaei]
MSDGEYETADAGASNGIPILCGALRKNGYVIMKGRPCKIVDASSSKTGKHGSAKVNFVGIDIFTNKKYEECRPSSHTVYQPVITRQKAQVLSVESDGYLQLLLNNGTTRDDIHAGETLAAVTEKLKNLQEGEVVMVNILSAMDEDKCTDCRVTTP